MKTQLQMYESARRKIADADSHFMNMILDAHNTMTSQDLEKLIAYRPAVWGRYEGFLEFLKEREVKK